MATGEKLQSRQFLQFIKETVAGTYDAAGDRAVLTMLKGEVQPEEAWESFKPDGVSVAAWNALSKEHVIYQGTIRWDYTQFPVLADMLFGVDAGAVVVTDPAPAVDVEETTYALSPLGGRDIPTYTIEYGQPNDCERCTYAIIMAISLSADRDGTSVEGNVTILARKPTATGVAMTDAASITIAARNPMLPQHFSVRVASTRAGLAAAAPVGKVKSVSIAIDNLIEPVWYANEGVTTYDSHADNDERTANATLHTAINSAAFATIDGYAKATPSTNFWTEFRFVHPDTKHLQKWQLHGSVSGTRQRTAAGKVRAVDFNIGETLDNQPFNENLVADGGASLYLVARRVVEVEEGP